MDQLENDAHLKAIGFFRRTEHPSEGPVTMLDLPVRYDRSPGAVARLQPRLGEHSEEVLREAGLSDRDIDAMRAEGATQ